MRLNVLKLYIHVKPETGVMLVCGAPAGRPGIRDVRSGDRKLAGPDTEGSSGRPTDSVI